ncbi:MAG TPA: type II toxin-antitoxin system VapC family toxin [Terracidiphilus sp.]|nr:type II toxin-antitoxin system VapC family toxin [Terracidiphilus sp.]
MTIYADSSFFVPLYALDAHSAEATRRISSKPAVWFTPFHRAEIAHSLHRQVFRARISAAVAALAWNEFEKDCQQGIWHSVEFSDRTWQTCIDLARRHGPALGVRTLDSLHVACALELRAQRFWTFDDRQAKLAQATGLDISS